MMLKRSRVISLAAAAVAIASFAASPIAAQAPADVAAKFSGTWKVNRALSPALARPGRGRGAASAGGHRLVLAAFQRGGGGAPTPTTEQDLTPEEMANRAAIQHLQQIPEVLTISATPESIAFTEARGTSTFNINNKAQKIDVGDTKVDVKSKWDKGSLRQEFSTPQRKLVKTWTVDENGRLVLKVRVESVTLNSADAVAVFDKQ